MIKAYYRPNPAGVLVRDCLSQPFCIRSDDRQGCILSLMLFNYSIDWILGRALQEGDDVEFVPGHRLTDPDFADDIALLSSTFGDQQSLVSRVNEAGYIRHNRSRTKYQMAAPSQLQLSQHGVDAEHSGPFKDFGVRDPVLSSQFKHSAKAADMEVLELPGMVCIRGPGLRFVQECLRGDDLVYLQFGVHLKAVTIPHGTLQSAKGMTGFGNPVARFVIDSRAAEKWAS
nr:unnamed protein product [Spirometra erinaceieuropaei]